MQSYPKYLSIHGEEERSHDEYIPKQILTPAGLDKNVQVVTYGKTDFST